MAVTQLSLIVFLLLLYGVFRGESLTGCNEHLTNTSGTIMSPNYPDNYPNNASCSWLVNTTAGSTVNISFVHFDVESHQSCGSDYVEILDGETPGARSLGKFCGSNLTVMSSPLTSSSNVLRVNFVSNRDVTRGGFMLMYSVWPRDEVCHPDVKPGWDCFQLFNHSNTLSYLPDSPSMQGISFYLFTRKNPFSPQTLGVLDKKSVEVSNYDVKAKVAFIIHGFTGSSDKPWVIDMTKELLIQIPNVIAVDWKKGAAPPGYNYFKAAANTRVVGVVVATMIETLGVDLSNVHIIGYSLGAHAAGYAGKKFPSTKIGRITGLDPAGPLFRYAAPNVRLGQGDAAFVHAIHTNAPKYRYIGLGMIERSGHVDMYPNGGKRQPGCAWNISISLINLKKVKDFTPKNVCSHARATGLFTASINNNTFPSYECLMRDVVNTNWVDCLNRKYPVVNHMGFHATPSPFGAFVLKTGDSAANSYHLPPTDTSSRTTLIIAAATSAAACMTIVAGLSVFLVRRRRARGLQTT